LLADGFVLLEYLVLYLHDGLQSQLNILLITDHLYWRTLTGLFHKLLDLILILLDYFTMIS